MSDAAIDDRDERLAVVFDQMMQASKPGSPQKRLDDAVRLHPDLARDLRELFATTLIVDDIAMLQSTDLNHLTGGGSTFPRTSGSLAARSGGVAGPDCGGHRGSASRGRATSRPQTQQHSDRR